MMAIIVCVILLRLLNNGFSHMFGFFFLNNPGKGRRERITQLEIPPLDT